MMPNAEEHIATILLAPNGARRKAADHPHLPLTAQTIARCAAECRDVGADGIHVHVRDRDGGHLLDIDAYNDVTAAIHREAGADFFVQITSEAVNLYTPAEQMAVVLGVKPRGASCALRELLPDASWENKAGQFFNDCAKANIAMQHIVYSPAEIATLSDLVARGVIPDTGAISVLCVLGRNDAGEAGQVQAFHAFCMMLSASGIDPRTTMFCAFGQPETRMLSAALSAGRNVRVGFENNLLHCDGSVANNNAARVQIISEMRTRLSLNRPDSASVAKALGMPHTN